MATGTAPSPTVPRERTSLHRPAAFWTVAATMAILLAASSAPSPLYAVFQQRYGFSTITLTVIFAVYVVALLSSLLVFGRLSDHVGRRPVLAAALAVQIVAMLVFLGVDGVGWLVVARVVQGLATGAALGALSAYLLDLQPPDGSRLGSLTNSVAPAFGLGIGAIGTGLLVQYAPAPTTLVFAVLALAFLVLLALTALLPETVHRVPGALAALRPRVAVPSGARRAFVAAAPTMLATWALGGLMLSVGGSLIAREFGQPNEAVIGLLLGVFALCGALGSLALAGLPTPRISAIGSAVLIGGAAVFVLAVAADSLAIFVVAAVVAGTGFGSAFLGALRAVSQLAAPHERAGLLSAVLVVSYLGFSIPALVAGVAITHVGLHDTALGYAVLVLVLAVTSVVLRVVRRDGVKYS